MEKQRFQPMNNGYWTGVIEVAPAYTGPIDGDPEQGRWWWVVEPEYRWKDAQLMANELNKNPDLDPDDLTRMIEAG